LTLALSAFTFEREMKRAFSKLSFLRDAALAAFYPQNCRICEASVETLANGSACNDCWEKTRLFDGTEILCGKCGRLLRGQTTTFSNSENIRCHRCDEMFFDAARAVGVYEGALREAVLRLKREPFVPEKLQNLLAASSLRPPLDIADLIIPVPLHARRERARGFNQAAILARVLSRDVNLRVAENCLKRTFYAPMNRIGMDERARRESVAASFVVKHPRILENARVLLVDDVFTTGATASACAQVLKEKGASRVFVFTIARAF
jgi:competence protein ComFC